MEEVQRTIRSCAGCGLCCTEAFNAVQILPIEADRIANHLLGEGPASVAKWEKRLAKTVKKYGLADDGKPRKYTCAFFEADFRCALPIDVKPIACLAFNPIHEDACDQEPDWYHRAHAPVEKSNSESQLRNELRAIPIAVQDSLKRSR